MMKNEKKYMFWVLGIFLVWIIISAFWYTCGLKGFCKNEVKVKDNSVKELVEEKNEVIFEEDYKNIIIPKKNTPIKNTDNVVKFNKRKIKCLTHINSIIKLNSNKNINSEVKKLENFFNNYFDKELVVDGYFGLEERDSVIEFQKNKNLDVDGVVGPKTLEVINAVYCVKNEKKN